MSSKKKSATKKVVPVELEPIESEPPEEFQSDRLRVPVEPKTDLNLWHKCKG